MPNTGTSRAIGVTVAAGWRARASPRRRSRTWCCPPPARPPRPRSGRRPGSRPPMAGQPSSHSDIANSGGIENRLAQTVGQACSPLSGLAGDDVAADQLAAAASTRAARPAGSRPRRARRSARCPGGQQQGDDLEAASPARRVIFMAMPMVKNTWVCTTERGQAGEMWPFMATNSRPNCPARSAGHRPPGCSTRTCRAA